MSWKENNQNWVDRMDNAAFGFGQFLGRLIYISTKKPGNKRTFPDFSPPPLGSTLEEWSFFAG